MTQELNDLVQKTVRSRASLITDRKENRGMKIPVIDFLEDVLELPIVGLQYGVLSAHVKGPALIQGIRHATVSEIRDGLGRVVHSHSNAAVLSKVKHLVDLRSEL